VWSALVALRVTYSRTNCYVQTRRGFRTVSVVEISSGRQSVEHLQFLVNSVVASIDSVVASIDSVAASASSILVPEPAGTKHKLIPTYQNPIQYTNSGVLVNAVGAGPQSCLPTGLLELPCLQTGPIHCLFAFGASPFANSFVYGPIFVYSPQPPKRRRECVKRATRITN